MPNTSESAYQHLRPAFQSWDQNVGSINQTPSPHKYKEGVWGRDYIAYCKQNLERNLLKNDPSNNRNHYKFFIRLWCYFLRSTYLSYSILFLFFI